MDVDLRLRYMKLTTLYLLTVNGVPNLDSDPKVESGKETPISEIAIF